MNAITDFSILIEHLRNRGQRSRVAVVWPEDSSTRSAVEKAITEQFAEAIMIGCRSEVEADEQLMAHRDHIAIIDVEDGDDAAAKAVELVREGKADVIMKGMLNTDNLLRPILNKETGILPKGKVLTHVTAAELPDYSKMLLFSDAAVIPYPNLNQRIAQVEYLTYVAHALGCENPRVALIHCSEKVDGRHFPFTLDYQTVIDMSHEGKFGNCIVDGPMDVKTACSLKSMQKKRIDSPIMGAADALIFPDIEAANAFYKTITLFADADTAAILQGALTPVVVSSRGDSTRSKFLSLALAAL